MAALVRQPFAPLDGARLQSLTSVKNVQNSIPLSSPSKRKAADLLDATDLENVDPKLLFKRAKSTDTKDLFAKPAFLLSKSASSPIFSFSSTKDGLALKASSAPRQRTILNPKSPSKKLTSSRTAPLSAPAGRSPTNPKRIGILNKRRGAAAAPLAAPRLFSLDAALKGTVPSYAGARDSVDVPTAKSSWHFEIHEDTAEQEMTNLLQHSTCRLDISSDEEGAKDQMTRDRRGKENIPPADDISQTSTRSGVTVVSDGGMEYEKPRVALGDLNVEEFYAAGVDPGEVIIVPGDEDDGVVVAGEEQSGPEATSTVSSVETEVKGKEVEVPSAVVLQPVEGTGEAFDLWESSSAKDEIDSPVPASPASEAEFSS